MGPPSNADPDDVGSDPGGGVRAFFYALGLSAWGAVVLAVVAP